MLNPREINVLTLGDLRSEVLKQAKIELRMNLSLLEMLKGNTSLDDLANFREDWIHPLEMLVQEIEQSGRQTD